ncbi:phosphoribosylformylglycinamidine synthase subunit PurL [Acidobacteria bacterium AH-259-D05]|nr:phosphoribosylformylglycinamidine synthase subunit PurL [Acidobacteria bacterium AH-259-D05]
MIGFGGQTAKVEITLDLIENHGLSSQEYDQIKGALGREPNLTELGIFSVMWSEHCSYKSSRPHLSKLPTQGPHVIEGPGENAGVLDIGEGLAAVFKIESHNHPSFIEPYEGAATGVGGIIRDIFTMGARPIALLDSLHFGPLQQTENQLIMEGVVAGIAGYGNCMGIPTVGGEIYFQEAYSHNPIVNVFCLGIAATDEIFRAKASGVGNPIIYVGAKTGRDGIHGATMASEEFSEDSQSKRPNVQVGDPFLEKLLLEACLEAMQTGAVVGIQDMGAAGLTCSTCEMGSRGVVGVEIELTRVPQREKEMTPYEIMLSESQERMLLVAEKGREEEVLQIFRKWDLDGVVIGEVRKEQNLTVYHNSQKVADISNSVLADEAPLYERPAQRPHYLDELQQWQDLNFPEPSDYNTVLLEMARSSHLCSRRWVFQQYDHMVRTNTVILPGSDAAVLRLKGTEGGLAVSLDGNCRYCFLDPRMGAMLAVSESCRNVVCSGARPIGATNCLNFGSPENPEVMWQFIEAVEGIRDACKFLGTPITGGNVSFYNETNGTAIFPTPVLGIVGKIDGLEDRQQSHFTNQGDQIYLLGDIRQELGGSVYLEQLGLPLCGPCPTIDLSREKALQDRLLELIQKGLIESAHDVSEGGIAFALAECCFALNCGIQVEVSTQLRPDYYCFSEAPTRVVVSVNKEREPELVEAASGIAATKLGQVIDRDFQISINKQLVISLPIQRLLQVWDNSLEEVFRH